MEDWSLGQYAVTRDHSAWSDAHQCGKVEWQWEAVFDLQGMRRRWVMEKSAYTDLVAEILDDGVVVELFLGSRCGARYLHADALRDGSECQRVCWTRTSIAHGQTRWWTPSGRALRGAG